MSTALSRTSDGASTRPTRARFIMLTLISVAVMINYLDRGILGVAAPAIRDEFRLSPAVMGVVLSAFGWSYFAAQIPFGILLDRIGPG
ncbi:MAG: transporter [Caulobacteraceae bacterium]|nr:transporter [Caulobacteraceae bacterium]